MKEKNKKDERLESLFSEYVQDEKMPPVNVTQAAKEYMNKKRVTEKVAVPVTVTAGENGSDRPMDGSRSNKAVFIAVIGLFLAFVVWICCVVLKKPGGFEFFSDLSPVSPEQITEVDTAYPYDKRQKQPDYGDKNRLVAARTVHRAIGTVFARRYGDGNCNFFGYAFLVHIFFRCLRHVYRRHFFILHVFRKQRFQSLIFFVFFFHKAPLTLKTTKTFGLSTVKAKFS